MIDIARINQKLLALFKIRFVKDTVILQFGTLATMGANLATSVLLARILQPERYGIYALVFSLYGLIGLFGNVGVGQATVTRLAEAYAKGDEEEITNLLAFFVKMSAIMATFISIVGFLVLPYLAARMYGDSEIGHMARPLFLIAPLGVMYGLVTTILQSVRMMQQLTILESLMTILTSIFVIGFVFLGLGVSGIVYGHVLATALSSVIGLLIYHRLRWQLGSALPSLRKTLKQVWQVGIKKYFGLGFLIAVDKNIVKLADLMPILLLGIFVKPEEVSYFKIAVGAIGLPLVLLGAISRNLAAKLPEVKGRGDIREFRNSFLRVSVCSGFVSSMCTIAFVLIAPYLVKYLYGEKYLPAVNLIHILAISSGVAGFGVGLGPLFRTAQRMDLPIKINLSKLAILIPIGLVLVKNMETIGAALFATSGKLFSTVIGLVTALAVGQQIRAKNYNR